MDDPSETLTKHWGLEPATVTPLSGGMNSATWLVEHHGSTYVAKHVPPPGVVDLVAGAQTATALAEAGFATGRPVPARDGRIVLTEHGLALLEHVPGRELDGETDEEQVWIAEVLAGVHAAGEPNIGPPTSTFALDWLSSEMPGVESHPWLVAAIEAVRDETDHVRVTWSVLHTDPAPEAFIHDESTDVTGLIDWAGSRRGPVLYDVASALMYLGGPHDGSAFLRTYVQLGQLTIEEMQHLDAFRRFREAVQGAYFAGRSASRDLTGGINEIDNTQGLDDARRRLGELGFGSTRHVVPPS